jgi:hypothetical protein
MAALVLVHAQIWKEGIDVLELLPESGRWP